jgi:hypothetical protein
MSPSSFNSSISIEALILMCIMRIPKEEKEK